MHQLIRSDIEVGTLDKRHGIGRVVSLQSDLHHLIAHSLEALAPDISRLDSAFACNGEYFVARSWDTPAGKEAGGDKQGDQGAAVKVVGVGIPVRVGLGGFMVVPDQVAVGDRQVRKGGQYLLSG